ncbi:OSJNBa0074B10.8 protein, related [Eimeria necatrix]|uniref:OSJNBa0074B10.8 protein, related n=1 Tax=Eimeria necatrix TaxID=51315 RepID=U6MD89_9EIME|nr:OSJNBa0074B10.8 protein, related [Eimeria necatrix]CDJ62001.1 OSJNBa0074B10.8 protein, related [Eimeria necatrix]
MFMGPDFAKVARPLVDLTRKGVSFQWTDVHTQAVRKLKQRLIDYTTLQIPDTTKPFELYTDASGYAVGAVLEQAGQPIGFLSQAMTPAQQKYSIYDQELLALVSALDKWAHLLRPAKVTAHTDHQALTYLQQLKASKPLRGRTARWLDFLAEFPELTITYLPGARNQVADALSRIPYHSAPSPTPAPLESPAIPSESLAALVPATGPSEPSHETRGPRPDYRELACLRRRSSRQRTPSPPVPLQIPTLDHAPESPTPTDHRPTPSPPLLDWSTAYSKCPVFCTPYNAASDKQGEVVQLEFQHRRRTFRFVHPYLHICVNGLWLIWAPQFPEFLTHVLYTHHDHVTAGHRGQKKTYKALSKRYYWPGMRTYTNEYVESCTQCRASKSLNQKPAGLLQQLLIPSRRWSHVSLDFVTDLPLTTSGHDAILVVVDSLSKMAHFIPAKKSLSAADTVELLADRLIRYHGFPEVLISDRDPRFQSEVWSQLCSRFNITRAMSSSYHPQTDGRREGMGTPAACLGASV